MANFPGLILTNAGRQLQAKAQIGQQLQFTRVALGSGNPPGDPEALTGLIAEEKSLSIQGFEVIGDGTSKIRAILTNEGVTTGFFVREIGVFARDPDTLNEQLYSYSNSDSQSDFLPAEGGATVVEQIFDLITVVGNATNITAVIDDYITLATKANIEEIRPYLLPTGGMPGQLIRKASSAEGDTEWFDPDETLNVHVHSITEERVAIDGQQVFNLVNTRVAGLAVYINGSRLPPSSWSPLGTTQVRLDMPLVAYDRVQFVNNEEVGEFQLAQVSLSGPALVYPGSSNSYTITDFDAFSAYTVSTDIGSASISGDTVTLDVAAETTAASLLLTVGRNGASESYAVAIGAQSVAQPAIVVPSNGSTGVGLSPILTGSAFDTYPTGVDTQLSADWQIASDSDFTSIVWSSVDNTNNLTSIDVPNGVLAIDTEYFARVRYQGNTLGQSSWSSVISFTTTAQYITTPTVTAPANGATNIPPQPVFQAGAFATYPASADGHQSTSWRLKKNGSIVWQSLNDSSNKTSIVIPNGVLAAATTYQLDVRHHGVSLPDSDWSNPVSFTTANVFVPDNPGTPFAGGYFVSRMFDEQGAEYALVLAPRSAAHFGQTSWADAWNEAAYMTYGGYGDWVLPDLHELMAIYWAMKPGSKQNFTGSGASTRIIPATSNYTATNPGMTALTAYKTGGSEAFLTVMYWARTVDSAMSFASGEVVPGLSYSNCNARAIRRVYL